MLFPISPAGTMYYPSSACVGAQFTSLCEHETMLVAHIERRKGWDLKLAELAFATRTVVNRSTSFTPAQLDVGKELQFP